MSNENKNIEIVNKIKENYINIGNILCGELDLLSSHQGLTGHVREDSWIDFFRKIIPQKFAIEKSVIIIDSTGKVSKEVDIAVFDNQYTPYLFNYGNLKFIPIEAVSVVIECKSTQFKKNQLKEWSKSIKSLKSVATGIARTINGGVIGLNKTQSATTPITILAGMFDAKEETIENVKNYFDFVIYYSNNKRDNQKSIKLVSFYEEKKLGWWMDKLNRHDSTPFDTEKLEDVMEANLYNNIDDRGVVINSLDKETFDFFDTYHNYLKIENIEENIIKDNTESTIKNNIINNTLEDFDVSDNPLLSLNFKLNQLLMLINNPMMFPHLAYVKMFNDMKV